MAACRCGIKTAVVPGGALAQWSVAMSASPFGAASVTEEHPYLGAIMVAPSCRNPAPSEWEPGLLCALGAGAWKKAGVKMAARSG
eukprot:9453510-Alexandrium_andersonii.AAC.1